MEPWYRAGGIITSKGTYAVSFKERSDTPAFLELLQPAMVSANKTNMVALLSQRLEALFKIEIK